MKTTTLNPTSRLLLAAALTLAIGCGGHQVDPQDSDGGALDSGSNDGGSDLCPTGQTRCGASCVDLQGDPLHCGGCDDPCAAGEVCDLGTCRVIADCTVEPCVGLTYCDLATRQCVPGCISDTQCAGAQPKCDPIARECVCEPGSCPTGQYCDVSSGTCDTGCISDTQCSGDQPRCDVSTHACVCEAGSCAADYYCNSATGACAAGCINDAQCSGEQPHCDVSTHRCVCEPGSCNIGEHCDASTGACAAGCISDAQCAGDQPTCDTQTGDCVCNANSCTGFHYCEPSSGACVSCGTGVEVSAGTLHTCALKAGGLKCWGNNFAGGLGDGTTTPQSAPVNVTGLTSGVAAVASGSGHTCALLTSGGVKCWGYNNFGQLGNGTDVNSVTPVDVTGLTSGVSAVVTGGDHSCALLTTGGVKCWGRLGSGLSEYSLTPVDITGVTSGVVAITMGNTHGCALLASGGIKCWGGNFRGQLGDGTTIWRPTTAANVSGLTSGVASVVAGGLHTCALLTSDQVKCWGYNWYGQLGDGTNTQRTTPVNVIGLPNGIASIAAGNHHTCAVTATGGAKCWGENTDGQLGDGTHTDRNTPVDVVGLAGVTSMELGHEHSCASLGCELVCWGDNWYGQLGDGTNSDSTSPVSVIGY